MATVHANSGRILGRLLGKADAAALVTIINAGTGTPSPQLKTKLDQLLGAANASAIFTIIGTANTAQPKLVRALAGLMGNNEAQRLVVQIEAS